MIRVLLIGAALAAGAIVLFHPEPRRLLRPGPWTIAVVLAGLLVVLTVTGRLYWLAAVGAWLIGTAKWWLWPLVKILPLLWQRWRGGSERAGAGREQAAAAGGAMSAEQARRILGVAPGADREAIVAAHRRMVQRLHPDRGGSDYLTAQLNEAKEVLLGERGA